MNDIAQTPEPPYYAAIFSSLRTGTDAEAYGEMATRMFDLAKKQPGYLGVESAASNTGLGITVSYWKSREDIERWKAQADHQLAQRQGREKWYSRYALRIALVESARDFCR